MINPSPERPASPAELADLASRARSIRRSCLESIAALGVGHVGGSMSVVETLAILYFRHLRLDPENPRNPDRDRFVLSKGHACPVWYAALALRGYFPVEELSTLRRNDSRLQGHPVATYLPGIDATSGSLGLGFGQALGMALDSRLSGRTNTVWAVLGDGELDEGVVWETAAQAAKYRLDNLVAIVDRNNLQNDGRAEDILPMEPIDRKFEAFNWRVLVIDGHDMRQILSTLEKARERGGRPTCVIARTVKGKGVSFMEDKREWHGKPPSDEERRRACEEIEGRAE